MSKQQKLDSNSTAGSAPKVHRTEQIVYATLGDDMVEGCSDPLSVLRTIGACKGSLGDKALELHFKSKLAGRMVTLDNMKNSDFYKRISGPGRSACSVELVSERKSKGAGLVKETSSPRFSDCEELNRLWKIYAKALFHTVDSIHPDDCPDLVAKSYYQQQLLNQKLELVGSNITVSCSSNKEIQGFSGIVFEERENILRLVDKNNKVRSIPKNVCTFSINFDDRDIVLHGPDIAGIGRTGSVFRASGKIQGLRKRSSLVLR